MHNREIIVASAAHQPVRFGNPIVVPTATGFNMFVVNCDERVAIPSGVFMMKTQRVPQFMCRHPLALPPPKRSDVDIGAPGGLVTSLTRIISGIGTAGEADVSRLSRPRNKRNSS